MDKKWAEIDDSVFSELRPLTHAVLGVVLTFDLFSMQAATDKTSGLAKGIAIAIYLALFFSIWAFDQILISRFIRKTVVSLALYCGLLGVEVCYFYYSRTVYAYALIGNPEFATNSIITVELLAVITGLVAILALVNGRFALENASNGDERSAVVMLALTSMGWCASFLLGAVLMNLWPAVGVTTAGALVFVVYLAFRSSVVKYQNAFMRLLYWRG